MHLSCEELAAQKCQYCTRFQRDWLRKTLRKKQNHFLFYMSRHKHHSIITHEISGNKTYSFLFTITMEDQLKQIILHGRKQYIAILFLKSSLDIPAPASVRDFHLELVSCESTFTWNIWLVQTTLMILTKMKILNIELIISQNSAMFPAV